MTLFDKLVSASGLSAVFARASLSRAIARVAAKPETLSPDQLKAALPDVEKVLSLFLAGDELNKRIQAIKGLIRPA